MPNTFVKLQTVNLQGTNSYSVWFNNIPQGYTDLLIRSTGGVGSGGFYGNNMVTVNTSAAFMYSSLRCVGIFQGSNFCDRQTTTFIYTGEINGDTVAPSQGVNDIWFANYASGFSKSGLSWNSTLQNSSTNGYLGWHGNLALTTDPITSIQFTAGGGVPLAYNTYTLYGIKNS